MPLSADTIFRFGYRSKRLLMQRFTMMRTLLMYIWVEQTASLRCRP